MSKAFVDTSILANVLLKTGELKDRARNALGRFGDTITPHYALKELRAGALRGFQWFHNRLVETASFAATLERLARLSATPQRHLAGTALEALREAELALSNHWSMAELVAEYGRAADPDRVLADRYRLAIRVRVESAWRRRTKVVSAVVAPLPCYTERAPEIKRELLVLEPYGCDARKPCGLRRLLARYSSEAEILIGVVEASPSLIRPRGIEALKLIARGLSG